MTEFLDLPLDLLPLILQHLIRPTHVAQACLVSKDFYGFAITHLYRRVFIYAWHTNVKTRFVKLFRTLAGSPGLARFVEELTIRDFPRALKVVERAQLLETCLQGIQNCVNLRACTWTRDGSLSDDLLQALCQLSAFTDLEINGHNERQYSPLTLAQFVRLRRLCLIMPSTAVCEVLPHWLRTTGPSLQRLTLIDRSPSHINDALLEHVASQFTQLDQFHLLGCSKVTHKGLWEVISKAPGLVSLGAEALYQAFDMAEFSRLCISSGSLSNLRSITISQYADLPTWGSHFLDMLSLSPLEFFHISSAGGDIGRALSEDFVDKLLSAHGHRLRRFSVQRMHISMGAIHDICLRCPNLEELFVVVELEQVDDVGPCLALTRKLRSLHINRSIESSSDDPPIVSMDRILALVKQSRSELRQIGFSTRVWQIQRDVCRVPGTSGELETVPRLGPYEHPELPEQFLVLRA